MNKSASIKRYREFQGKIIYVAVISPFTSWIYLSWDVLPLLSRFVGELGRDILSGRYLCPKPYDGEGRLIVVSGSVGIVAFSLKHLRADSGLTVPRPT